VSARFWLSIGLLLTLLPGIAWAHKESDAYLNLHTDPHNLHRLIGQWDIALRDLDVAIGLDRDGDGALTAGCATGRPSSPSAGRCSPATLACPS